MDKSTLNTQNFPCVIPIAHQAALSMLYIALDKSVCEINTKLIVIMINSLVAPLWDLEQDSVCCPSV